MRNRITIRRALLGIFGASFLIMATAGATFADDAGVSIVEEDEVYSFQPAQVTVGVGDTVTWTNDSDAPHTVTSDETGGPLGSDEFGEDDRYAATFDSAGDYAYHCEIHDYMQGVVHVVRGGDGELPPTDVGSAPTTGRGGGVPPAIVLLVALAGILAAVSIAIRRGASGQS